jgi:hypothetical protein
MFESRGSIVINKAGERLYLKCRLVGMDRSILEFFQERWPAGSVVQIQWPEKGRPETFKGLMLVCKKT